MVETKSPMSRNPPMPGELERRVMAVSTRTFEGFAHCGAVTLLLLRLPWEVWQRTRTESGF
jgi:hypothetical protein